jgi:ATP synthase F subunit
MPFFCYPILIPSLFADLFPHQSFLTAPSFFTPPTNQPIETPVSKIIEFFKGLLTRGDISLILISQTVAESIRPTLQAYNDPIPTVLEIPSKEFPYDGNKDPLMQRINKMLGQNE